MKSLCRLALPLAGVLCCAGPASSAEPLTPAQHDAVQKLIEDYIANHPEAVLDAVERAQRSKDADTARRAIAAKHAELFDDPSSPVGGNAAGDVTIVEFFDYRCPYCKEVEPLLEALLKEDRKLRIVYKEFPILGPASVYAARVALAAREQGKYDDFHRKMMAVKGTIDDGVVLRTAAASGLDVDKIKAATGDEAIERIIRDDYALAEALDIQGTPAFIVGDTLVPGVADIDTLRRLIAAARQGG